MRVLTGAVMVLGMVAAAQAETVAERLAIAEARHDRLVIELNRIRNELLVYAVVDGGEDWKDGAAIIKVAVDQHGYAGPRISQVHTWLSIDDYENADRVLQIAEQCLSRSAKHVRAFDAWLNGEGD